tara:strand:+ start:296 stop:676 length:381 start_codon:yes stop_codon:yes gene_type:complete
MNINQINYNNFQVSSKSGNEKNAYFSIGEKISFDNIRNFRQDFEKEANTLRSVLGEDKHQIMIVAMFEGTERLLNQDVSEFAVHEYLEGLKLTAKELSLKGITGERFRNSLIDHSISSINNLLTSS